MSQEEFDDQCALYDYEELSIRVSSELLNRIFAYCDDNDMLPDDLVALAVSLELANPEGAGVESWRKEPFTSQVPIELVQELTDVCAVERMGQSILCRDGAATIH